MTCLHAAVKACSLSTFPNQNKVLLLAVKTKEKEGNFLLQKKVMDHACRKKVGRYTNAKCLRSKCVHACVSTQRQVNPA